LESLALSLSEPVHEHINQSLLERELFAKLKQEHDLAKAVKSDDAEVPVDLWNQAVCRSTPSEVEQKALTVMRDFMLAQYHRRLWLDARKYLQVTHGKDWSHSRHTKVLEDLTAIQDILWRGASNTWFEYPLGSRLIFFRFPARYCTEAKLGVRVFFTNKGPSSRRRQPPLKPDKKAILRKKLLKFINKGYLAPHVGRIESLKRQLHQVLRAGEEDGGHILHKLLQTSRQLGSVPEGVARRMLRMSGSGQVPDQENSR
jgi:hypothetical protein